MLHIADYANASARAAVKVRVCSLFALWRRRRRRRRRRPRLLRRSRVRVLVCTRPFAASERLCARSRARTFYRCYALFAPYRLSPLIARRFARSLVRSLARYRSLSMLPRGLQSSVIHRAYPGLRETFGE